MKKNVSISFILILRFLATLAEADLHREQNTERQIEEPENNPLWNLMSQRLVRSQAAFVPSLGSRQGKQLLYPALTTEQTMSINTTEIKSYRELLEILVGLQCVRFHIWSLCCAAEHHSTVEESCVYVTQWTVTEYCVQNSKCILPLANMLPWLRLFRSVWLILILFRVQSHRASVCCAKSNYLGSVEFYCCYFNIVMSLLNKSQFTFSTIYNKQLLVFKFKISRNWTSTHHTSLAGTACSLFALWLTCHLLKWEILNLLRVSVNQPDDVLMSERGHTFTIDFPGIYVVESVSRVKPKCTKGASVTGRDFTVHDMACGF